MSFIPGIPGTKTTDNKSAVTLHPVKLNTSTNPNNRSRIEPMTETQTQRTGYRTGGKVKTKTTGNNRYNSVMPRYSVESKYKSPESSSQAKTRLYGIDGRNGSPIKLDYEKNDQLFINPFEVGGYEASDQITKNLNNLAVNVVEYKPTGFDNSIAAANFNLIFSRFMTKLAVDSNATTNKIFTKSNFYLYINLVTELVDLWYELDTLLAWEPEKENNNNALQVIKSFFNKAEILQTKYDIRQFITDLWIPKGILDFIRWKNQTYRVGNLPQTPCFRLASPTVTSSIDTLSPSTVIDKLNALKASLDASATTSTAMSVEDRSFMVGILNKYNNKEGLILTDLPLSCNTSVYDLDMLEYFSNSTVMFDGKFYPASTKEVKSYISFQNPEQVSELTLAMTGYFNNNNTNVTGLIKEHEYALSSGQAKSNKWVCDYQQADGSYKLHTRNAVEWNITHDFHFVDNQHTGGVIKVSLVPNGAQRVFINGTTNSDICVRMSQNKMFGI